ncbi:hypothetical protein [Mesorhizobium ventifaucium]|nr:hypothetical protein [Mesorhizobium ventifaucium]
MPKFVERRLLQPYSDTILHRVEGAAAVRALGVLIRKHPRTALDMLGSGLAQAGLVGIREIKNKIKGEHPQAARAGMPKLTKRQLRRLARTVADKGGS